jgi:hypothetical protein
VLHLHGRQLVKPERETNDTFRNPVGPQGTREIPVIISMMCQPLKLWS